MKTKFSKTLSIILAMLMLVSGLEVTGFASNVTNNSEISFDDIKIESEKPNIENEIISKRTAYSKVFSTDDGGYYSVVSATPIHIKDENGKFQNIEEPTIELTTESIISEYIASEATLINTTNSFVTYSAEPYVDNYESDINILVKCFGKTSVSTTGNFIQGSSQGDKIVCIKPVIEQKNIFITSAKIRANALATGTVVSNAVVAKKIASNWDENTTSKPDTYNTYFDCVDVRKSSTSHSVEFDVTHLTNSWQLELDENNGIALVASKKSCNVRLSEITMSFYYREIDEFDSSFTYETINMGNAGTLYINHFSCLPILKINDIGIDGERAPALISHIYNPIAEHISTAYGNNFRLNYNSVLKYSATHSYAWNTIEGRTINFFFQSESDNKRFFISNDPEETFTLELQKNSQNNLFEPERYENITITNNHTDEEYTFESHVNGGYLKTFNDGSGNNNNLTFNYEFWDEDGEQICLSSNIATITDAMNRQYMFNYTNDGVTTYLDSINVFKDDSPITVGNANDLEEYKVKYSYQIIDNDPYLTGIDFVGESNDATYTYDDNHRLSTISNGKETLTLTYDDTNALNKVKSYKIEYTHGTENDSPLEEITIDNSKVYERVFTNSSQKSCIIHYDENYNIVYYKDYDGTVINGIDVNGETTYLSGTNNINLVINGDFESTNNLGDPVGWIAETENEEDRLNLNKVVDNTFLQLNANLTEISRAYQLIEAPDGTIFKAGDSYAYGGTVKISSALVPTGNRTLGIYIFDAIADGDSFIPNECISHFNFDYTLNDTEQQKLSYFTLEENSPALFVYICFDYNYESKSALFDNIKLFEYEPTVNDTSIEYLYDYDPNEYITSAKIISAIDTDKYIGFDYCYNVDGTYLSMIEDDRGIKTYYTYNPDNGRLVSVAASANSNAMNLQYTAAGLLSSVQQTVTNTITGNTVDMKIDYGYTDGMLSSVTHDGYGYSYIYDDYGNVTEISINTEETPLTTTTYANGAKHRIGEISYANGDCIVYGYDDNNPSLITEIYINPCFVGGEDNSWKTIHYSYDSAGNLSSMIDYRANIKIECSNNSYTFTTLDNNTTIYQAVIDNNSGNTVEFFNQFESKIDNTISPSVQTANDLLGTTISSSQTLNKVVAVYNDHGSPDTDENGVPKTRVSETYTYEKGIKYDEFMRPTSNSLLAQYKTDSDNIVINSEENYTYRSDGNKETTLISSYRTIKSAGRTNSDGEIEYDSNGNVIDEAFIDLTYSYKYDVAGNIEKIELNDNIANTHTDYNIFKYDDANQLIFEYSVAKNSCICYSYDSAGNITEKRVYSLSAYDITNETIYPNAVCERYIFTYDETYKDRLVSMSSSDSTEVNLIEYDDLGNPLNYDIADGTFEWKGHLLTAFETNGEGNRYEYEYDANGLRTRKILYDKNLVNGSSSEYTYTQTGTIEYVWVEGVLKGVSITNTAQNTNFFMNIIYDENGIAQGYVGITGTPYYFVRDPLGNITSIIGATTGVTVEVKYDAWGNPTFPTVSDDILVGFITAFVCSFNPSTYKGYLYDFETGLYCCGNRYYSPVWSRFINMDASTILSLSKGNLAGANPYAYCNNNPVNFTCINGNLCEQLYFENPYTTNAIELNITHANYNRVLFVPYGKREYLK